MRRKRGQNFLIDGRVAKREVEYACIEGNETVLEIGPGKGILTRFLLEKARVIAIERDELLYYWLARAFRDFIPERLELIKGDALKVNFPKFDRVVSNIPYGISSPLTFKLLKCPFKKGVMMYQWEYAKRMVAKVGDKEYSRLSVGVYYYADVSILEKVPACAFRPVPKVDSALVEIRPRRPPFDVDERKFFWVANRLFQQRRKKVRNILDVEEEIGEKRGDQLSPEEIAQLANSYDIRT
jgi:16S rRNA (adenine1518-N6/adenine1519-N6)-dimethyltransferase